MIKFVQRHQASLLLACITITIFYAGYGYGEGVIKIPGTDESKQLTAAGTLLRLVDSVLFSWGARLLAGVAVLGAGWNLKEQRFGMAFVCIAGAVVIGTAPLWVKNIFSIGGGTLFGS